MKDITKDIIEDAKKLIRKSDIKWRKTVECNHAGYNGLLENQLQNTEIICYQLDDETFAYEYFEGSAINDPREGTTIYITKKDIKESDVRGINEKQMFKDYRMCDLGDFVIQLRNGNYCVINELNDGSSKFKLRSREVCVGEDLQISKIYDNDGNVLEEFAGRFKRNGGLDKIECDISECDIIEAMQKIAKDEKIGTYIMNGHKHSIDFSSVINDWYDLCGVILQDRNLDKKAKKLDEIAEIEETSSTQETTEIMKLKESIRKKMEQMMQTEDGIKALSQAIASVENEKNQLTNQENTQEDNQLRD